MYNYADDNTVSYARKQLTVLKAVVESETEITLNLVYVEWAKKIVPCKFRDDFWRPI